MVTSVVMIVPDVSRAAMNSLGELLNYGPDNWSRPLSPSGTLPATHWGTHVWESSDGLFRDLRIAVQSGQTPPGLEAYSAALATVIIRTVENSEKSLENWALALSENGLSEIPVELS